MTAGQLIVYIDGVRTSTVDTGGTSTAYRQLIWTRTYSASARHTVRVVNRGTTGRPGVTVDGLAYLR